MNYQRGFQSVAISTPPAGKRFSSRTPSSADSPSLFQKTPTATTPLGRTLQIKKKNLTDLWNKTGQVLITVEAGWWEHRDSRHYSLHFYIFWKTKQNINSLTIPYFTQTSKEAQRVFFSNHGGTPGLDFYCKRKEISLAHLHLMGDVQKELWPLWAWVSNLTSLSLFLSFLTLKTGFVRASQAALEMEVKLAVLW